MNDVSWEDVSAWLTNIQHGEFAFTGSKFSFVNFNIKDDRLVFKYLDIRTLYVLWRVLVPYNVSILKRVTSV